MSNYKVDHTKKWDYENGFYLTCETGRIGKFLNHLEIYKKIIELPGDVLEFGVYKGTSLMRLFAFRELFENQSSRRIIGFDAFGSFPKNLELETDISFVERFEELGGEGISLEDLTYCLEQKRYGNYELVPGDINITLPTWIQKNPQKRFSLIHIDVDVYEPTITVLRSAYEKLVPGGILMLDDWGTVEGETIAIEEFFKGDFKIQKPKFYHIPSYIIKS